VRNPVSDSADAPIDGSAGRPDEAMDETGGEAVSETGGKDDRPKAVGAPGRFGPRTRGCLGVSLSAAGIALIVAAGLLGPSAAEPALPGSRVSPPFDVTANPAAWLVTVLLDLAIGLGAVGLALVWTALRDGWAPPLRPLVRGSNLAALAVVFVPPMGSADHLVYAAYGRLVTTGGNPYVDTAKTLAVRHDPIGLAVQPPWTNTPSVYGPVGTAEQAFASWVGGDSVHTTVFILSLLGALAFIAMGAMLRRMGDPARVTLLFSLNPLLLFEAVNAAHLDAFAAAFAVAGLFVLHRRRDLLGAGIAGVLIGLGCATKLNLGLAVLAGLWGLSGPGLQHARRNWRRSAAFVAAAAIAGALTYLPYGTVALTTASNSSQMISLGSAWRPLSGPLQHAIGAPAEKNLISLLGWALMLLLVWLLAPVLRPGGGVAARTGTETGLGAAVGAGAEDPSPGLLAARALALLGLAWVLAAPYTLPWYDVLAWAPLVVCLAGPVDLLALARLAVLSLAYVPGLDVPMPPGVTAWGTWIRADAAPVFSIAAIAWCVLLGVRRRKAARRCR